MHRVPISRHKRARYTSMLTPSKVTILTRWLVVVLERLTISTRYLKLGFRWRFSRFVVVPIFKAFVLNMACLLLVMVSGKVGRILLISLLMVMLAHLMLILIILQLGFSGQTLLTMRMLFCVYFILMQVLITQTFLLTIQKLMFRGFLMIVLTLRLMMGLTFNFMAVITSMWLTLFTPIRKRRLPMAATALHRLRRADT